MQPQKAKRRSRSRRHVAGTSLIVLATAFCLNLSKGGKSSSDVNQLLSLESSVRKTRFVTLVLISNAPKAEERPQRIRVVEETWGRSANAIYAVPASYNASDYAVEGATPLVINADDKPFLGFDELFSNRPKLLVLPPDMDPMASRDAPVTQYVVSTIHERISEPNMADFVLFANDHTFVLPDNVCQYLESKDPQQPLHAGHALVGQGKYPFNSGAMGFILSKATVAQLVQAFETGPPPHGLCAEYKRHYLTECLYNHLNVSLADTRDAQGKHRFHGYGIIRTIEGKQDSWYIDFHKDPQNKLGFSKYAAEKGRDCCSPETTTFHYVQEAETRALYKVRNTLRTTKLSDAELQQLITQTWPKKRQEIGGYASGLPPASNTQLWEDLLHVVREITPESGSAYANGC